MVEIGKKIQSKINHSAAVPHCSTAVSLFLTNPGPNWKDFQDQLQNVAHMEHPPTVQANVHTFAHIALFASERRTESSSHVWMDIKSRPEQLFTYLFF